MSSSKEQSIINISIPVIEIAWFIIEICFEIIEIAEYIFEICIEVIMIVAGIIEIAEDIFKICIEVFKIIEGIIEIAILKQIDDIVERRHGLPYKVDVVIVGGTGIDQCRNSCESLTEILPVSPLVVAYPVCEQRVLIIQPAAGRPEVGIASEPAQTVA